MITVFVTKYQRGAITKEALDNLCAVFASVYADFEARLVEFDGKDAHVQLLANDPPDVLVPTQVNSLEDMSSRIICRKGHPTIRKQLWAVRLGRRPISQAVVVTRR